MLIRLLKYMKTSLQVKLFWIMGILFFLFTACHEVASKNKILTAHPPRTETLLPHLVTSTRTERNAVTPTLTAMPTNLRKATSTFTWTRIPTLSHEELVIRVKELEDSHGGCLLPCWWGITPGKTTWEEASSIFESLSLRIIPLRALPGKPEQWYGIDFGNLKEILKKEISLSLNVKNGVVNYMRLPIFYPLYEILSTYGTPEEIWVTSKITQHCPWCSPTGAEFALGLLYKERGFLTSFRGAALSTNRSTYRICPENVLLYLQTNWLSWDPALKLPYSFVNADAFLYPPLAGAYRLEVDSDIDIHVFYERYKEPQNASICFEVPNRDD